MGLLINADGGDISQTVPQVVSEGFEGGHGWLDVQRKFEARLASPKKH